MVGRQLKTHFLGIGHRIIEKNYESRFIQNCFLQTTLTRGTSLGTDDATKTDEFSENFQRGGGGGISIKKFMLQILDL